MAADTKTPSTLSIVDRFLDQTGRILQLRPNYVRRHYRDAGRLQIRMQASMQDGAADAPIAAR